MGGFPPPLFDPWRLRTHLPGIARFASIFSWSLPLFRVRGIQLAVHSTFFLLLAYAGYEGWMLGVADDAGWESALINIAIVIAMFTCVLLHELGHSFTAMSFGIGVRRILLMPIGGMAEFEAIPRQPVSELLITAAGPAVNFAIAGVLYLAVGLPDDWDPLGLTGYAMSFAGFAQLLLTWNLAMGLFNLLPAFPMDGGRIFRALLATSLPYLRATHLAATVGKILAGTAIVVALYFEAYLLAVLFTFIILAGELELRAVRRSEVEDAHWRAYLARLYQLEPSAEDPPLLHRQ